jgi:hypothetical protein
VGTAGPSRRIGQTIVLQSEDHRKSREPLDWALPLLCRARHGRADPYRQTRQGPAIHVDSPNCRSRQPPPTAIWEITPLKSRHVRMVENRLRQPPGATRRASPGVPRRHGAPDAHPLAYPNSAQATSGAGACWCVVAGASGVPGPGRMVATPTTGRRASGPWLLLGGRGEATLATVHADAPHLGLCWERAIPQARPHRR